MKVSAYRLACGLRLAGPQRSGVPDNQRSLAFQRPIPRCAATWVPAYRTIRGRWRFGSWSRVATAVSRSGVPDNQRSLARIGEWAALSTTEVPAYRTIRGRWRLYFDLWKAYLASRSGVPDNRRSLARTCAGYDLARRLVPAYRTIRGRWYNEVWSRFKTEYTFRRTGQSNIVGAT
jgi:hypothetical protein